MTQTLPWFERYTDCFGHWNFEYLVLFRILNLVLRI